MVELKTDRLVIRNFVYEDWKDLQEIALDKEASEYAVYDHPFPTSEQEVKGITEWFAKGDHFLAVQETAVNKVIGYIALNGGGNGSEMDLGYCFHSLYQGKGYATEACTAVIHYAFDILKAERLTSGTANLNYPSCRLLNRLGFRKTGEGTASFRKSPEGNPIEFVGAAFQLEKKDWVKSSFTS